jgi:ammonia channel protein AmtB
MHLGFACVESGLTQSEEHGEHPVQEHPHPCIGLLTYALCGFNLMYPGFADGDSQFWFKFAGFGITTDAAGATSEPTTSATPTGPTSSSRPCSPPPPPPSSPVLSPSV